MPSAGRVARWITLTPFVSRSFRARNSDRQAAREPVADQAPAPSRKRPRPAAPRPSELRRGVRQREHVARAADQVNASSCMKIQGACPGPIANRYLSKANTEKRSAAHAGNRAPRQPYRMTVAGEPPAGKRAAAPANRVSVTGSIGLRRQPVGILYERAAPQNDHVPYQHDPGYHDLALACGRVRVPDQRAYRSTQA